MIVLHHEKAINKYMIVLHHEKAIKINKINTIGMLKYRVMELVNRVGLHFDIYLRLLYYAWMHDSSVVDIEIQCIYGHGYMVFNTTFNKISIISWWCALRVVSPPQVI
jgi:hypothetical protein